MTTSLLIGPTQTLTQSVVYALPARQVRMLSSAVLEVSVDNSSFTAVAATTTGTDVTAGWAKCTTGAAVVVCRV
jgi:hypothetical protein